MSMQIGFSTPQLAAALRTAKEALFRALIAEQQHASATLTERFHPEIGLLGPMTRSFIHTHFA